jgi:hypothetical protein
MSMKMKKTLLALTLLLAQNYAQAQWTTDSAVNTQVRDIAGFSGTETKIATAPNGKTFISWAETIPSLGYRYRLQLLDVNGNKLWPAAGILVDSILGSALYRYDMKTDNEGNALVAVQDIRSAGTNIPVVFKVDQAGAMMWGAYGIQLNDTAQLSGLSPVIGVTTDNNVIVAWSASNGSRTFVSAQKFSPTGTPMWADNLRIRNTAATAEKYERPQIIRSEGEDVVIQYVKRTGSGLGVSTMFAQRYNATGLPVWAAPAQVSTKTIGFAYFPAPVSDGYNGFIVNFTTSNPVSASLSDAFLQRVYADGHTWNVTGNQLSVGSSTQKYEAGNLFVAGQNAYFAGIKETNSGQSAAGILVQKVDTAGNMMLGATAPVVLGLSSGAVSDIVNTGGMKDVGDGLIFQYVIGSAPSPMSMRAIKSTYAGVAAWPNSVALTVATGSKSKYVLGDYVGGQLVAAWSDDRNSTGGIYAQNLRRDGRIGVGPCPVITLSPATVPGDTVGRPYNAALSQTGSGGRLVYTVTTGTLPAGFTLSAAGVISGTATTPGTASFTVTVTDTNGCTGTANYTINTVCPTVSLAAFSAICDTARAYTLSGGLPAGGTYVGSNVTAGTFNAVAAGAGTHTIRYAYAIGTCKDTATQTIVVNHCGTGVPEVPGSDLFEVFPNPAQHKFTLNLKQGATGMVRIKMTSIAGQLIYKEEQAAVNGGFRKTYDFSGYPKGIYLLEVSHAKGTAQMKLILQ